MALQTRNLFCVASMFLFVATAVGDYPQWRGPARDGTIPDFHPPTSWPSDLEKAWRVEVGLGHGTPVQFGDKIVVQSRVGGDEIIQCLSLADGERLWRHAAAVGEVKLARAVGRYKDSPRSTPTVADGRVFALAVNGALTCLDAKTGAALWRHDFAEFRPAYPEFGAAASPLVANGTCICVVGNEKQGAVAGWEAASGKLQWKLDVEGAAYSSPVLLRLAGKPTIVVMSRTHLLGVSPEGKKLWTFPYETRYEQNILTAVCQGDRLYVSGYQNPVIALDVSQGKPREVWSNPAHPMYMSSPVLHGDRLYGMSQQQKGHVFCIDTRSGKTLWETEGRMGDNVTVQRAGELLVLLSDRGGLAFARAQGTGYEELARYQVASGFAFAYPVLAGRQVLVKDEYGLTCWRFPPR